MSQAIQCKCSRTKVGGQGKRDKSQGHSSNVSAAKNAIIGQWDWHGVGRPQVARHSCRNWHFF